MAPVGSCRLLLAVDENTVRFEKDAASLFRSFKAFGSVKRVLLKCQPVSGEVCQSRCNVILCVHNQHSCVFRSHGPGYGAVRQQKCRRGSDRGLEASPFTAGTSIESGVTLLFLHPRLWPADTNGHPPPREQPGTIADKRKRTERISKEKRRKLDGEERGAIGHRETNEPRETRRRREQQPVAILQPVPDLELSRRLKESTRKEKRGYVRCTGNLGPGCRRENHRVNSEEHFEPRLDMKSADSHGRLPKG